MKKIVSSRVQNQSGFTLAELLIAALISAFVVTAGFQLFIDQSETHMVQKGITDMQQNGRATIDELANRIRQAGYLLPLSVEAIQAWDTNPDTIAVAFLAEPICTASLSIVMASEHAELRCEDSDISCFEADSWAYIHDPVTGTGEYFYITGLDAVTGRIYHSSAPLSKPYPDNSLLYVIDYYKYYVDDADTTHPLFMMEKNGGSPSVYADNIGDLQLRYVHTDGSVLDTITLDRYVRRVNISAMVQSEGTDFFVKGLRHDTLRTTIEVRNLSL